jgi:hypothetical protein
LFEPSAPCDRCATHGCVAYWGSCPSGFHRFFATRPVRSETNKQFGNPVLTMALFGTRGPQLFRVLRGGLGSPERLRARGMQRLTNRLRLALDPECRLTGHVEASTDFSGNRVNQVLRTVMLLAGRIPVCGAL